MKTPISMNEDGILLDAEGRQIASIMPGKMRRAARTLIAVVNGSPALEAAARDFIAPYAEVTDAQLRHVAAATDKTLSIPIMPGIATAVLEFRAALEGIAV